MCFTKDAEYCKDVRARLGMGQAIRASLNKMWRSHGNSIEMKIKLENALIRPLATYGC